MSDTATAPAPGQTTQAPAAGFLGGEANTQAAQAATNPSSFFSPDVVKEGRFNEGWTQPYQEKYPTLAGRLATAKDESGALSLIENAIKTASGRERKSGAPNEAWKPEEVAEYRKANSIPEKFEEYKFKPEAVEVGVHWPEDTNEFLQGLHGKHASSEVVEYVGQNLHALLKGQTDHALGKFEEKISTASQQTEQWARQEWGRDYDDTLQANKDFVRSVFTEEDQKDPLVRAFLSNPKAVALIDEVRRGRREGTIPGTNREMPGAGGSNSPGQQAALLMKTPEYVRGDPSVTKRVMDLYNQQAAQDVRKGVRR